MPISVKKLTAEELKKFNVLKNKTDRSVEELNQYVELRDERLLELLTLFDSGKLNKDTEKNELLTLRDEFLFGIPHAHEKEGDRKFSLGINSNSLVRIILNLSNASWALEKKNDRTPAEKVQLTIIDKMYFGNVIKAANLPKSSKRAQDNESSVKTQIKPTAENNDPGLFASMIQSFKNWFNKSPVKNEQGEHIFSFPSEAKAIEYCRKRAADGKKFRLENEDKKVLVIAKNNKIYNSENVEFLKSDKFFIAPFYRNRDERLSTLLNKSNRTDKETIELLGLQKDFLFGTDQSYRTPVNKLHNFDLGFPRNMTNNETKQRLIDKYLDLRSKTNKSPEERNRLNIINAIILNNDIQPYTKTVTSPPSVKQQSLLYYVTESNRKFEIMRFEHEENVLEYCRERAQKKESFKLFNQEQTLVAYSKGDGCVLDAQNNEIDSDATSFSPRACSSKFT